MRKLFSSVLKAACMHAHFQLRGVLTLLRFTSPDTTPQKLGAAHIMDDKAMDNTADVVKLLVKEVFDRAEQKPRREGASRAPIDESCATDEKTGAVVTVPHWLSGDGSAESHHKLALREPKVDQHGNTRFSTVFSLENRGLAAEALADRFRALALSEVPGARPLPMAVRHELAAWYFLFRDAQVTLREMLRDTDLLSLLEGETRVSEATPHNGHG